MQTTLPDQTLQASERQVVMALTHLGLEKEKARLPITYCSYGGTCIPLGSWSVRIEQSFANQVLASEIPRLVSSRFDQLVTSSNKISVLTASSQIDDLETPISEFNASTSSYTDYKAQLTNYLNTEIAPSLYDLLGDAAEARYLEMNAQEKDTFIRVKAQATGMPVAVLENLISTGYAFGLYLPEIQGTLHIQQTKRKLFDGREIYVFHNTLSAPLQTRLIVFKFDGKQFSVAHEISATADGNLFNAAAQHISGSGSVETLFLPSRSNIQSVFNDLFKLSFKDSTIALSTKLKEIREFAIASPVLASDKKDVYALGVGVQENIRVDHPFSFYRTIDNKETRMGWGQVREVGDNCLALPAGQRTPSQAHLVQGQVNELDLAVEHPWTGVYGRVGLSVSDTSLEINGQDTGAGAANFLEFGFIGNLGYLLNNPSYSEVWANMDIGLGMTSAGQYNNTKMAADSAARFRFGAEKRYPMGQGFYSALGADFAIEAHNYRIANHSDPLKVTSYNLIPRAELGYFANPNLKLYGGVAYNLPLSSSVENFNEKVNMAAGVSFNLGLAMHVNFAGPFAIIKAPPSNRCDNLRNTNNQN
ncbi:hypothetical protein [Thiomicrospira microaerophila]|uniref:hypothetical protein n=1 Tax=Thiomicrospira microaerophila TaxID=406020 RepID=UPI0012FD3ACA|nr:hypothetical protein [Thiomicrospira microaerophila]